MKLQVFAILDSALAAYGQPFFQVTRGQALRTFSDTVNSKEDSNLSRHPDDFDLYHIGEYDDSTGSFVQNTNVLIARGKDVKTS